MPNLVERRKGWNAETLKIHYDTLREADRDADRRFHKERDRRYASGRKDDRRRLDAVITTNNKALDLLAAQQKEYKEASNEWRSTLNDMLLRMMSRTEVENSLASINSKIDAAITPINQKIDRQHTELLAAVTALQQADIKGSGKDEGLEKAKMNQRYIIGLAIGLPAFILAAAAVVRMFM